jgi:peptidase E
MAIVKQIIALGGGGLSLLPEDLALIRYVLAQSGKERPRVCFVSTAGGDSDRDIHRFYEAFCTLSCEPRHLALFAPPCEDLEGFVAQQDLIYVGGGNTRNLLALWREWGLDRMIRAAYERGTVLAGVSAGSICWFEQGVTDSVRGSTGDPLDDLSALSCLGFLSGSACPHYDGETARRPVYQRLVSAGELGDGYAADDGAGLHFAGGDLVRAVAARPGAQAYRVERRGEAAVETPITPDNL